MSAPPFQGYLQALLTALAEGGSVDWTEADARARTGDDRKTLRELRALVEMTAAAATSVKQSLRTGILLKKVAPCT